MTRSDLPSYSVVIVTRNRPEALALSLPLILAQEPAPAQTLIVDSSDEVEGNRVLVAEAGRRFAGEIRHIASERGASHQRNRGLADVAHPVVLFPDDDSLLHPGTMAAFLSVYHRDTEEQVGGVCSAEALAPPPGSLEPASYDLRPADRVRRAIAPIRFAAERRFVPEPFLRAGRLLQERLPVPEWIDGTTTKLVEMMTGFRMSFRTDVLRRVGGFDETLGAYSLFEDVDAGFGVMRSHLLVAALDSQIYHHKAPARRDGGFALGAMQALNRGYVLAKHGRTEPVVRRQLARFHRYKAAQYAMAARSPFGRDRLNGFRAAAALVPRLMEAPTERVPPLYRELRENLGLAG